VRERRRSRADLHQSGDDVVVQRPRIDLPDTRENLCEAEEFGDPRLQRRKPDGVTVEQVEHVLCGTHRPLDAAQRVPVDQRAQSGQGHEELFGRGREPLTQRGGLCGDVVTAPGHHEIAIDHRPLGQSRHHRDTV
jgi:hypothetical protein